MADSSTSFYFPAARMAEIRSAASRLASRFQCLSLGATFKLSPVSRTNRRNMGSISTTAAPCKIARAMNRSRTASEAEPCPTRRSRSQSKTRTRRPVAYGFARAKNVSMIVSTTASGISFCPVEVGGGSDCPLSASLDSTSSLTGSSFSCEKTYCASAECLTMRLAIPGGACLWIRGSSVFGSRHGP